MNLYLRELETNALNSKPSKQKHPFALRKISRRSLFLIFLDSFAISLAFFLAFYLRSVKWNYELFMWCLKYFASPIIFLSFPVFLVCFYIFDLYNPYKYFKRGQTFVDILYSLIFGGLILASISYMDRSFLIARPIFVIAIGVLSVLIFGIRMMYDAFFTTGLLDARALIVGTGLLGRELMSMIHATPHSRTQIVGFVSSDDKSDQKNLPDLPLPVFGDITALPVLIRDLNVQLVIFAVESDEKLSESEFLYAVLNQNVQVTSAIHLFEKFGGTIPYQVIHDYHILTLVDQLKKKNYLKVKRLIDIVFAFLFLFITSPVFLMTILVLSFQGIQNIFFVQTRIGKNRVPFQLFKFRTMAAAPDGQKKVTRIGQWLRKYRIDELPQILNVLKGDMSFVGPRPEIPFFAEECQKWIPHYNVVFALKPGLTGWAQVRFKYTTSEQDYERKFSFNLYYLKNVSAALDLIILLKTIRIILLARGQ